MVLFLLYIAAATSLKVGNGGLVPRAAMSWPLPPYIASLSSFPSLKFASCLWAPQVTPGEMPYLPSYHEHTDFEKMWV